MSNSTFILHESCSGTSFITPTTALLKERKLFLTEKLDSESAADLLQQVMCLELQDSKKEITVYISSPGGEITPALTVFHYLRNSKCPITTVCIGFAASAAAILFLAGDKRLMYPDTEFMIHSCMSARSAYENAFEAQVRLDKLVQTNEILCNIVASRTGKYAEIVKEWMKQDTYFTPEQALEAGAATGIITDSNN